MDATHQATTPDAGAQCDSIAAIAFANNQIRELRVKYRSGFPERRSSRYSVSSDGMSEIGRSGVLRDSHGRPRYDCSPDMEPVKARGLFADHGVYHEMMRSEPAIHGVMRLIIRSVAHSPKRLKPIPNPTEAEAYARRIAERYLGLDGSPGWMRGGLRHHLAQALLCRGYGFTAFEVTATHEQWDGQQMLVPGVVSFRAPSSVEQWLWQGETLVGMVQRVQSDQRAAQFTSRSGRPIPIGGFSIPTWKVIPASKLLLYTHNAVDGNPEGTADLRPLWIYWQAAKDTLIRWQIGEETQFGGLSLLEQLGDQGQPYETTSKADINTLKENMQFLAEGTLSHMTVPYGWKVSRAHSEYDVKQPVAALKYFTHQIFLGLQAILLGLDESHSGSMALSKAVGALFYDTLEAAASEVLEVLNGQHGVETTGLLRRLIDWNMPAGSVERYPEVESLGFYQDLSEWAEAIRAMQQYRVVTFTAEDEMIARELAKLHRFSLDEIRENRDLYEDRVREISQDGTQIPPEMPKR